MNNLKTGTQTSPWKKFSHACNTVTAGNTIHVNAGTYIESHCDLAVGVNLEGDGAANTIIKSNVTGQWSVYMSLQSPQGTPGNQTISNIQFDGQFTGPYSVSQPGPTNKTWWAIEVRGRANVTMHDIKVVNFVDRGVVFDGNDVQDPMTTPYYSSGNRFYNNTILNSAQHNGQYGSGLLNIGGQKD